MAWQGGGRARDRRRLILWSCLVCARRSSHASFTRVRRSFSQHARAATAPPRQKRSRPLSVLVWFSDGPPRGCFWVYRAGVEELSIGRFMYVIPIPPTKRGWCTNNARVPLGSSWMCAIYRPPPPSSSLNRRARQLSEGHVDGSRLADLILRFFSHLFFPGDVGRVNYIIIVAVTCFYLILRYF